MIDNLISKFYKVKRSKGQPWTDQARLVLLIRLTGGESAKTLSTEFEVNPATIKENAQRALTIIHLYSDELKKIQTIVDCRIHKEAVLSFIRTTIVPKYSLNFYTESS